MDLQGTTPKDAKGDLSIHPLRNQRIIWVAAMRQGLGEALKYVVRGTP